MKQTNVRFVVDALLLICLLGVALIGLLMAFIIPSGPRASETAKVFLGLHRHDWGDVHLYLGLAFVALSALHVILGWSWVKGKARQLFRDRWALALTAVPVLGLSLLAAFWCLFRKFPGDYEGYGTGARAMGATLAGGEMLITGDMSLLDIERGTGVPAERIFHELNLPSEARADETLGRLRRKHSFAMTAVRDAVVGLSGEGGGVRPAQESPERAETAGEGFAVHEQTKLVRGRISKDASGILITGQMSLYDIQARTGIPARTIAARLGVPATAPLDWPLGRLRRVYGFTMLGVREAVSALMADPGRRLSEDGQLLPRP